MSRKSRLPLALIVGVNILAAAAFTAAAASLSDRGERRLTQVVSGEATAARIPVGRKFPHRVEPFYNDPTVVSDDELRDVLDKVKPRLKREKLSSNHVEHALRTWGGTIRFDEPGVMDGPDLVKYLTDYGAQLASWKGIDKAEPLIVERPDGVEINWGKKPGESVHHDHWLACLTEAGVSLDTPIYGPSRRGDTLEDALEEAIRDFDPSDKETEWSVMAFGLWLPPEQKSWVNREGRRIDFDLLAETEMRGARRFGVCGGTHRVYSLMVLLRLDDEFKILSPPVREAVYNHLRGVRDSITLAQWEDGRWSTDWPKGEAGRKSFAEAAAADAENALADKEGRASTVEPRYRQVIATGHHLEWLAIAYPDLHPNRDVVRKAADWLIKTTREIPLEQLAGQYTFFSHVGNSLSLWRKTHPADAWPKLKAGVKLEQ